jgi:hypothetical protein
MIESRMKRLAGHVAHGSNRKAYRVLVGKPEEKTPLVRPRRHNNIKMVVKEIGWGGKD